MDLCNVRSGIPGHEEFSNNQYLSSRCHGLRILQIYNHRGTLKPRQKVISNIKLPYSITAAGYIGYMKSPYEPRAGILIGIMRRGVNNALYYELDITGWHLTDGFTISEVK